MFWIKHCNKLHILRAHPFLNQITQCKACQISVSFCICQQREYFVKNCSDQVEDIRAKYNELEKTMIKEKFQILEIIEKSYKKELNLLADRYDDDPEMDVVWNSDRRTFDAVMST